MKRLAIIVLMAVLASSVSADPFGNLGGDPLNQAPQIVQVEDNQNGTVMVVHDGGGYDFYEASADTDAARKAALNLAIAAATTGDVVYIGVGTYHVYDATTTGQKVTFPAGVIFKGASRDATIIKNTSIKSGNIINWGIGDNGWLFDLELNHTSDEGLYRAGLAPVGNSTANMVRCNIIGDTDSIYFAESTCDNTTLNMWDCYIESNFDNVNVIVAASGNTMNAYRCKFYCWYDSRDGWNSIRNIRQSGGGAVYNLYDCDVISVNSSSILTDAVTTAISCSPSAASASINVYNSRLSVAFSGTQTGAAEVACIYVDTTGTSAYLLQNCKLTTTNTGSGYSALRLADIYFEGSNSTLSASSCIGSSTNGTLLTYGTGLTYLNGNAGDKFSLVKTLKKTFDCNEVSTDDYQFDDDAANTTRQDKTITGAIPAYAEVISCQLRCIETAYGSASMTITVGTAAAGEQLLASSAPDTAADIATIAAGSGPILAATNAARDVVLSATPGANWTTLKEGRWSLAITYIDYGAIQ